MAFFRPNNIYNSIWHAGYQLLAFLHISVAPTHLRSGPIAPMITSAFQCMNLVCVSDVAKSSLSYLIPKTVPAKFKIVTLFLSNQSLSNNEACVLDHCPLKQFFPYSWQVNKKKRN